jgi:putative tricarboxylic transport membrane protein
MTLSGKTLGALVAGALGAALAFPAAAEYPERPIRVVVPYGAGGSTDIVARTIVNKINEQNTLGQPMAVLNVAGGAGPVGFHRVKDADPDGYEIMVTHLGVLVSAAVGTTPFGAEAFVPIAQTGSVRFVSAVSSDSPYQDFESFVAAAKAAPGEIPEANAIGGAIHMASLALADAAGYQLRIVQVGGGADRITSILGGHTVHTLFTVAEFKNFRESGLRGLVFLAPERHPDLPDLPAAGELGYDVDISVDTWWFAPLGTPDEVVAKLASAFEAALADPALVASLTEQGVDANILTGDALSARIEALAAQVQEAATALQGG